MWMVSEKLLLFSKQLSVQTSLWCSWPFGLELWSCESEFLMFCISCCWCKAKFKFWRSGKHPDNNAIVSVKTKQVINFLPKRCSTMTHFEFWTNKNKKEPLLFLFDFGVSTKNSLNQIFLYILQQVTVFLEVSESGNGLSAWKLPSSLWCQNAGHSCNCYQRKIRPAKLWRCTCLLRHKTISFQSWLAG